MIIDVDSLAGEDENKFSEILGHLPTALILLQKWKCYTKI